MGELLIILLVIYIIIGVVVYFVADTTTLASSIESVTPLTWGFVESSVFAFVVVLWPVWLLLGEKATKFMGTRRP